MKDDAKEPAQFTPIGDATFTPTNEATFTPLADEENKSPLTTAQARLQKIADRMGDDVARKVEKSLAWYLSRLKDTAERATGGVAPAKAFAGQAGESATQPKAKPSEEPPLESAQAPAKPKPPVMTPGTAAMAGQSEPLREANAGGVHIEPGAGRSAPSWAGRAAIGLQSAQRFGAAYGFEPSGAMKEASWMTKAASSLLGDKHTFGRDLADRLKAKSPTSLPPSASNNAGNFSMPQVWRQAAGISPSPLNSGQAPNAAKADTDDKLLRAIEKLTDRIDKLINAMGADESESTSQRRTEWQESSPQGKSMWSMGEAPTMQPNNRPYRGHQ